MSMLGGMFGGGGQSARNTFGHTQSSTAGRWVDVTLSTSRNPTLAEALQSVPAGTQLAPTLKLVAPRVDRPPPAPGEEVVEAPPFERPKGRMHLYWGCGEAVRPECDNPDGRHREDRHADRQPPDPLDHDSHYSQCWLILR